MPFVFDRDKETNARIVVDPERNISFQTASMGDPDGMVSFFLDWHGQRIYLEGIEEGENRFQDENGNWKFDLEWTISRIDVPAEFPETNEAVFKVITEALEKRGERDRANIVTVEHTERAFEVYKKCRPWQKKFEPKWIDLEIEKEEPGWIEYKYGRFKK